MFLPCLIIAWRAVWSTVGQESVYYETEGNYRTPFCRASTDFRANGVAACPPTLESNAEMPLTIFHSGFPVRIHYMYAAAEWLHGPRLSPPAAPRPRAPRTSRASLCARAARARAGQRGARLGRLNKGRAVILPHPICFYDNEEPI
jgi:hypothetical protein